ncbi:hypothetical protein LLH03_05770 [bacterium]|nr:hypothetical protein [bacterium]
MIHTGYLGAFYPLAVVFACGLAILTACCSAQQAPVPQTDLSKLKPSDFADDDLDMPYLLHHFARVANSVLMDGPNRGFLSLPVWRNAKDNKPYNARVMESHLTLAWFYCTRKPWNPYYASPEVRARLEAMLDFWCRMQNTDGQFSEYRDLGWNLPATAFATKFMGETLQLLHSGPPIDKALLDRVVAADRKAILVTLTNPTLYKHGCSYSNQFTNVWGGAFAYLKLFPDAEIDKLLDARLKDAAKDFQSPAGYPYEADGPDWGYNMGTHHSNLYVAWNYTRGTERGERFLDEEARWADWLSYNAVREPDGSRFFLNRAVETRGRKGDFVRMNTPLAEGVERSRAFMTSQGERATEIARTRQQLAADWPKVADLPVGSAGAYTPYEFLYRSMIQWYPTDEQQAQALAKVPYLARDRFNHQRVDSRYAVQYTFVRHPGYYAAVNTGRLFREQQRYGLGLLWNQRTGTLLQSQTLTNDAAWGTLTPDGKKLCEASSIPSTFTVGGSPVIPEVGNRDLPEGDLTVGYLLGKEGQKSLSFTDAGIVVTVRRPGAILEQIPLLLADTDKPTLTADTMTLVRNNTAFTLSFGPAVKAELKATKYASGGRKVTVLCLTATDMMTYRMAFADQ